MTGAIRILDDDGNELPVGEEGEVWFETTRHFEYHGDPEKTKAAWDREQGRAWLGDVGHVDEDGYLYLTDRASQHDHQRRREHLPREIEDVLVMHPASTTSPCSARPTRTWASRSPRSCSSPPGAAVTADELIAWTRERLSHFKCPREVRFVDSLPRLPRASSSSACSSSVSFDGGLAERAAEVGFELLTAGPACSSSRALKRGEVVVALRRPTRRRSGRSRCRRRSPASDRPRRGARTRLAGELAVLADRRVVLHLRGVALEAHQPVAALDLAGQDQLGDDRLERDAVLEHHADERRRHLVERREPAPAPRPCRAPPPASRSSRCRPA